MLQMLSTNYFNWRTTPISSVCVLALLAPPTSFLSAPAASPIAFFVSFFNGLLLLELVQASQHGHQLVEPAVKPNTHNQNISNIRITAAINPITKTKLADLISANPKPCLFKSFSDKMALLSLLLDSRQIRTTSEDQYSDVRLQKT